MDHHEQAVVPLHVLIFPLPIQSPVTSMLKLAELLSLAGLRVTFLNTHHIHHRLLKHTDVHSRFARYPEFRFETISDGLPEDHKRSGDQMIDIMEGIEGVTKPHFKEMLTSGRLSSKSSGRPITCIIADGFFHFAVDIAKEVGIPLIYFETLSPCAVWVHFCLPKLFEVGEIPFKGNDLDAKVTSVPGMENFLRRRDLPSFCRTNDLNDPIVQHVLKEDQELPRAQGVILNTFEDLEEPILTHIRTICPNLYPIGPIHALYKSIVSANKSSPQVNSSNSIWEEDKSCKTWLDAQPPKSVIYVSIGSLAVMTRDQLMEFWHGLVNSGKRFLWVQRQGSVAKKDDPKYETPAELTHATKERGCIVSWVQQEEVLGHPSIGAFLTHGGWNSTLESIVMGVPMICWPYFVDQQVNSRFVGEVWRIGVDMKDSCDRGIIEKMIRDVMEVRKDEFEKSANVWTKLARQSVCEGGSSYYSLARLIEDIRTTSLSTPQAS